MGVLGACRPRRLARSTGLPRRLAGLSARCGILVALGLLAGALPVTGHPGTALLEDGTYLNHTEAWTGTLAPGEATNRTVAWEGAPLQEGWLFLWSGTASGALVLELSHDEHGLAFEWSGGLGHTVLPATGVHDLVLQNPGDEPVDFALHYDQTCDCTGKRLPHPGHLWFEVDAAARAAVDLRFSIVPVALPNTTAPRGDITGAFTVRQVDEGGTWEGGRPVAAFPFRIAADEEGLLHGVKAPFTAAGGRHVILLELDHDVPGWTFQVRPAWVVGEPVQESPLPLALFVAAVLVIAVRRR